MIFTMTAIFNIAISVFHDSAIYHYIGISFNKWGLSLRFPLLWKILIPLLLIELYWICHVVSMFWYVLEDRSDLERILLSYMFRIRNKFCNSFTGECFTFWQTLSQKWKKFCDDIIGPYLLISFWKTYLFPPRFSPVIVN